MKKCLALLITLTASSMQAMDPKCPGAPRKPAAVSRLRQGIMTTVARQLFIGNPLPQTTTPIRFSKRKSPSAPRKTKRISRIPQSYDVYKRAADLQRIYCLTIEESLKKAFESSFIPPKTKEIAQLLLSIKPRLEAKPKK